MADCPHARPDWRMCPHCLGLNEPLAIADMCGRVHFVPITAAETKVWICLLPAGHEGPCAPEARP